jgi:prepilin-type N-terminal cleavage/methylation domain-containing protein
MMRSATRDCLTPFMKTKLHAVQSVHAIRNRNSLSISEAAFTLLELVVVIAIIGILASLLMPALARAKGKAQNTVCISQLRQLGIAVRLYSDDNNNRLPAAEILPSMPIEPQQPLPRICDALASYIGNATGTNSSAVFKCPGDKEGFFKTEGSSYEWNADLNGKRIDETRTSDLILVWRTNGAPAQSTNLVRRFTPETTPLLLDYVDVHPRPLKSGKNVVYMDDHVAPLDAAAD